MNHNAVRLDDNLCLVTDEVRCVHCDTRVGTRTDWLARALFVERPVEQAQVRVPAPPQLFVDAPTAFRQALCPTCLTALLTEVVAIADAGSRSKRIEVNEP
ncbi:hypothetical protein SUDANB60_06256 (plasmid) [Streptomyces sp. enrichment culture]|uniref:hypothetical protein n=1 Tax=Streptomyces sp. enrichment culture TaxID=1795815 RepID=UPI003F574DC5